MNKLFSVILLLFATSLFAQSNVQVENNSDGWILKVDGKDFMINGMNWDYIPIGTNTVNADFWKKSDDVIKAGLDGEMKLLQNMNVNVIRQYTGVPAKWIQYIYENYGIYTMLNHSFGRYGLTIDGVWTPITDYSAPRTQELLMSEVEQLVAEYQNTPGLLLYLLGNENNYGLFWQGAETESFPDDDEKKAFIGESRGRPMYKLMNEAAVKMKSMDSKHPVAMCNGDVLFIDIIAEECKDVDIFGTNTYRGVNFTDLFDVVKEKLNKPVVLTEFGADAFNAVTNQEDQVAQAFYMVNNWKDIYENAAGMGRAENAIGGFTFQFSDGWWKFGFDKRENADKHDNNASWPNGGYFKDFVEGENNMNEEWFGITAKGPTNEKGLYDLYPRAAYYALKDAHLFNPYAQGKTALDLEQHFAQIQLADAELRARGDKAALNAASSNILSLSKLRAEFTTFNTGGSLLTTPEVADENTNVFPDETGFDHMQSYYVGVEANPAPNMSANVEFNILGHVAENPINEIFYENRGRPVEVVTEDGTTTLNDINRVAVYNANFDWNHKYFDLTGFYRTGHYHWGYEGDFFGLYPEANYGPNLDIYQGEAPLGVEIEGKRFLKGWTAAFGPQLWWGANPALLLKHTRNLGHYKVTGIFHEDLDDPGSAVTSIAIPQPRTRRATVAVEREFGKFGVTVGGIWAGQPLVGREFQNVVGDNGDYTVYVDKVKNSDTWGGKVKLTYEGGKFNAYAQASAMGLVANGGGDWTQTFTGWKLKDTGSGNQSNVLAGFTYMIGDVQIAPNFLWQKPLVDPIPSDAVAPARPRNILEDPFVVRINRETVAGELLLTYDPTPGSWFYTWDSDRVEDAPFAMNAGFIYRHHPTSMDAAIGFNKNRDTFVFSGAPPAEDLWEFHSRMVSKLSTDFGVIANLYGGNAQANGSDARLIHRYGMDLRAIYKKIKLTTGIKIDDWGPYDYHRDFNLTYPLQLMADLSTSLGKPDWFILPSTQIGIRGIWRSLNQYSPRYAPTVTEEFANEPTISPVGFDNGSEWEIRTYIHINIGK